jgi:tellurite resistance protein TehA-like permease
MALGILSIASELDGLQAVSGVLVVAAGLAFGLVLVANLRTVTVQPHRPEGMRTSLLLFTWVAACGVLGERLASVYPAAVVPFALAAGVGWLPAMAMWLAHVERHARRWRAWEVDGSWLLVVVASESLAILFSSLARSWAPTVLVSVATVLWILGLAIYPLLTAQIARRIALGTVRLGELTPDYWIVTGALAISAVAAIDLSAAAAAATRAGFAALSQPAFLSVAGVALVCGALWIPVQLAGEVLQAWATRSVVKHDWLRWSTVFPLGMLSVASHEFGRATGTGWLETLSIAWFWAGITVAVITAVGHMSAALTVWRPSGQRQ